MKKYISLILILLLFCGSAFAQTKSDLFGTTKIWVVTWSGAKGNGTADDTTAFTNAIIKAANNILFIPKGTYKITNDVTAGATVEVWFANGVTLNIANTKTFTVSGKLHTPWIPTITGTGTFIYSAASMPGVSTAGIIAVSNGGTGKSSWTQWGIPYADTTTSLAQITVGLTGQVLQSNGNAAQTWSTPTYPSASQTAGKILRSDGTNFAATSSTFADTYAVSNLLYASSANVIQGLATGNSGVLVTSAGGVPSIATDIPTAVTIGGQYIYRAGGTDVPTADGGTGMSTVGLVVPLTYAGTIACDMSLGTVFTTTTVHATGNATINASNGTTGQKATFLITNDATTGKTITFGTNFVANGTLVGTVNLTAVFVFQYNGTSWIEQSRAIPTIIKNNQDVSTTGTPLHAGLTLTTPLGTAYGGTPATQTIRFHAAEFIPSPDAVNNSCTVSVGYDRTDFRSFFEITSGSATQDDDMVAIAKLPMDFVSFTANAISLDIYTIDYATSVATVTVIKNDNSTDVSASSVIASANTIWQTKTVAPAITGYAAGDNVKILIHIGTGDTASDYVRIARVYYTYNTR